MTPIICVQTEIRTSKAEITVMNTQILLKAVLFVLLPGPAESFLDWLFGGSKNFGSSTSPNVELSQQQAMQLRNTQFEMQSVEEKFAASGRELIARMSELDRCHLLVVSELKSACTDITEEDLAKLGVALLNCQSQSEGRTVYPCAQDMTVAECTKPMDPDTWNAYLIVSNRARSVCYSVRQQQFQRQTQFAVSQLATSAEDQLYLMEHLKQNQAELVAAAAETLQSVSEGQEDLMKAQDNLKSTQNQLQEGLAGNVESLMTEKALIAAGHKELAEMAENISKKLDNATLQLSEQDVDRQQYRKELMQDLAGIQDRTKSLIDQLDHNFKEVLSFQKGSSDYYQETLQKLLMVNQTVSYLVGTVGEMKSGMDEKLTWLTSLLGGAGDNLELLVTCVLHACYFFLAAFILTFLGTPVTSRLFVIMLVPLNALAEMNHGHSLDFGSLTLLIVTIISVNLGAKLFTRRVSQPGLTPPTPKPCLTCRDEPLKISPIHPIKADETVASFNVTSKVENSTLHYHGDGCDGSPDSSLWTRDETTLSAELASLLRQKDEGLGEKHKTTLVQNLSRMSAAPTPEKNAEEDADVDAAKRHLGPLLDSVPFTASPRRSLGPEKASATASPKRGKNASRVSMGSPKRPLCLAQTKAGLPCRLPSVRGSSYCFRHNAEKE